MSHVSWMFEEMMTNDETELWDFESIFISVNHFFENGVEVFEVLEGQHRVTAAQMANKALADLKKGPVTDFFWCYVYENLDWDAKLAVVREQELKFHMHLSYTLINQVRFFVSFFFLN